MSSSASLLFYIVSFIISVILIYLSNRTTTYKLKIIFGQRHVTFNPLLIIGVMIPIFVSGFRQDVGTDFDSYMIEYGAAIQASSYLEISFNVISYISNMLFKSPTFMLIAFSAMTVLPVILGINKSTVIRQEYRWIYWLLFLFIMFPQTFNLLRQGVSVAIGFYLIISIIECRKLFSLSHLAYLLLAVSFHASAWILVPIGYVAHLLNNKQRRLAIIFILIFTATSIVCFAMLPHILNLLGGLWSGYLDKTPVSRSVIPRSLLILLIVMIYWKYYSVLKITNSYVSLLWMGLIVGIGGLFVAYFERIGYYVTLLLPLLVLTVIAQAVPRRQTLAVNTIICIFALVYFVVVYYLMGSSDIFPYNWSI